MTHAQSFFYFIKAHLPGLLVLVAFALALFLPIPFADYTIAEGDTLQQFFVWTDFWVQEFTEREYPLWNPYTYGGQPFLGNLQIAIFYPTQFLLPLISPLRFFGWTLLIHVAFSGLSMYLLIYHLTRLRLSATLMGLVYMSCGVLVPRIADGHVTIINGLAWVPLLLWAYMKWMEKPSLSRFAWLPVLLGFQILAGQPQIPYLTIWSLGLISLYASYERWQSDADAPWKVPIPLFALLLTVAIATLLTAFYWLPFYEFNQLSAVRSAGTSYEFATTDSLRLGQLLHLLLPFLFGDPSGLPYWGSLTGYHEICSFLGIGTFVMTLMALFAPRFRMKWFWVLFCLVNVTLALGHHTALYRVFYYLLPGLKYFRVPGRFLIPFAIGMCVLGGLGIKHWFFESAKNPWMRKKGMIAVAVCLVLMLVLAAAILIAGPTGTHQFMLSGIVQTTLSETRAQGGQTTPLHPERYRLMWQGALIAALTFLLWLVWAIRFRSLNRGASVAAVALVALEMGWFAHRFIEPRSCERIMEKEYGETREIRFLKRHNGLHRVAVSDEALAWNIKLARPQHIPNRLMYHGIQTVRGYNLTVLNDYARYVYVMQGVEPERIENIYLTVQRPALFDREMLSALGVKYYLTPVDVADPEYTLVHQGPLNVYEYTNGYPRSFILSPDLDLARGPLRDCSAEVILYSPNEVRIRAELNQPGVLILADNYYPSWRAEANGEPAPIGKVLGTFRGIDLAAGEWEIRMTYKPVAFKRGLSIAIGTLVVLVFGGWLWKRRRMGSAGFRVGKTSVTCSDKTSVL